MHPILLALGDSRQDFQARRTRDAFLWPVDSFRRFLPVTFGPAMPTHRTPSARTRSPRRTESDVAAAVNAFRRVLREIRVMARKGELSTGLSPAQNFVLSVLLGSPGASVNELAEATLTDRSSVAAVVDRLVEQGYVVREQSPDDRRRASVSITATGRRAMRQASSPPPTVALIQAIRSLARDDQRSLATGLTALARAMGVNQDPAGMLFEDATPRRTQSATRRRRQRPEG